MERLKNRIRVIHIKDGFIGGEGKPLGYGEAPVAEVYAKAAEMGVLMVVESESLKPDGLTEARQCIEFLGLRKNKRALKKKRRLRKAAPLR